MLKKIMATGLGLSLGAAALPALADTHVTFVDGQGNVATQMYVKNGKVRMESEGGTAISLYDAATNTATVLLPGQKRYLKLDDESAAQVGAQADQAQQRIQAANAQAQAAMAAHQQQMDQANQHHDIACDRYVPDRKRCRCKSFYPRHQGG